MALAKAENLIFDLKKQNESLKSSKDNTRLIQENAQLQRKYSALQKDNNEIGYNVSQNSIEVELGYEFENDDAAWVMACVFMIFTMQTGFEIGRAHV